ncbi:major facilitator superfamily domain-containing protein [Geopyxis carbonaria]|nr:major facilitator superfamily domain-containing protein [Geopyxis carbonaria]
MMNSRGDAVLIVSIVMVLWSFTVVVLRFISKQRFRKRLTADDWLILAAWWIGLGLSISLIVGTREGLGMHTKDIPQKFLIPKRKARYAYTFLFNPALAITKNSVLVFYLSLFKNYKVLRWGTWITLAVTNVSALVLTLICAFQCNPLSAAFTSVIPQDAQCIDTVKVIYASAPVHIITDIAILLLPMEVLTSLKLPLKQKIALCVAFGGGAFVAVVEVVCVYYFQLASSGDDFDWNAALSFLWASITVDVGIISASIPTLKPLAARFVPSWLGRYSDSQITTDPMTFSQTQTQLPDFAQLDVQESNGSRDRRMSRSVRKPETDIADIQSTRQSIKWVFLIAVVFWMWGLAYGLLDVLNKKFEAIYGITPEQTIAVHCAYMASYVLSPLTFGGYIFRRYGFKLTLVTGLLIYGSGCMCFWPSSVQGSYPGIFVSVIIIGIGCGTIETAANPFAALCGPQKYAEIRVNVCQGFQGLGGLCALLLETTELYSSVNSMTASTLIDVQWVYLAGAFVVFILAAVVYCLSLPEIKTPERSFTESSSALFKGRYRVGFTMAVLSLGVYVAAQEVIKSFSRNYFVAGLQLQNDKALDLTKAGQGIFTAGRFLGAIAMFAIRPRWLLLICTVALTIVTGLTMTRHGDFAIAMYLLISFFEAICFPTIFVLAIRGLGSHIKTASTYLIAAISLGSILTPVYYAVYGVRGPGIAMTVPLAAFILLMAYPLYLNLSPIERDRLNRVDATVEASDANIAGVPKETICGISSRKGSSASSTGGVVGFRHIEIA